MAKIVISYRRADSLATVGRIFDRLRLNFDRRSVFMDIDNIPAGADFRQEIDKALSASDVMLVVIGRKWLVPQADGRVGVRNEHDWVRIEVETAFAKGLTIIPVLIDGAAMPEPADLPPSMRELAYRNAAIVDAGQDFNVHMERLTRAIRRAADAKERQPAARRGWVRAAALGAGGVAVVGIAAAILVFARPVAPPSEPIVEPASAVSPIEITPPVLRREVPAKEMPRLQSAESKPADAPTAPPMAAAPEPAPPRMTIAAADPGPVATPPPAPLIGAPTPPAKIDNQALALLVSVAERGELAAQWKLARMYAVGDGVVQSDIAAFEYFRRIADTHRDDSPSAPQTRLVASAFVALGEYYDAGIPNSDVKADPVIARQMFTYAATYFGDADAQYRLARQLLADGTATNPDGTKNGDPAQAIRWLTAAAAKGQVQAQALLGRILFRGQGVPRQAALGLMLLTLAKDGSSASPADAWISELYDQASKEATEQERAAAVDLLMRWVNGDRKLPSPDPG